MIHAFFVTIGVLAAIMFVRFLPLIVAFIWVILTSKVFWYCALWLVALLAAIIGLTPLGLIAMVISLPVLFLRAKRRERAEIEARISEYNAGRNKPFAPQAPLPFTMGDRYTQDGHEIHYTPRTFTSVLKPNSAFCPNDRIDWSGLGSRKVSNTPRPQYFDFGPFN